MCVLYVYVGYPLLVFLVARFFPRKVSAAQITPTVSIIITAYNEDASIEQKLENTLAIRYPRDKFEVIVASDCSSDETDAIVRKFSDRGVKLFRQDVRRGKTSAQNMSVERASGEIILFSDATTLYDADVLTAMIPNFADPTIGCVAGRLLYIDASGSDVSKGAKRYWNYETFLKESESKACSLIGVSGCLYAVRKAAYVPMHPEACSDFLIATSIYKQGLRTVYEPRAECTEVTNSQSEMEMRMRVRVISQTLGDLWRNREALNPFRYGFYAIQLISHKLLRYGISVFLLIALITSSILARKSGVFEGIFLLQMAFYALALIAWLAEKAGAKVPLLALPLYFVIVNIASIVGFYKFASGERYAQWEPIREDYGRSEL